MTTAITTYTRHHLDTLAEAVDRAQEVWELIDWTNLLESGAAVPCNECGGRGEVNNGVFGATECFACGGQKVIPGDAPAAPPEPPFRQMRLRIGNARKALQAKATAIRDRLLSQGCPSEDLEGEVEREMVAGEARGTLRLPAVELPTVEELSELRVELRAKAKKATQQRIAGRDGRQTLSRGRREPREALPAGDDVDDGTSDSVDEDHYRE